jgi:dolichol-phosphate mannosyltransferase
MLGFLASGTAAFVTDAAVLKGLLLATALSPLIARLVSIAVAMVVGWRMHRRFTFAPHPGGPLREFLRFASVGWSAAAVNYLSFAALILLWHAMPPLLAMTVSSVLAMGWSYLGYRFLVFRRPGEDAGRPEG